MINLLKALVILVLLGVIAGGAAGTYYFFVERPKRLDAQELAATGPAGQPTPDPSDADFEKARALKQDLNYPEAKLALQGFLLRYPDSTHHDEAETLLGNINYADLMSGRDGTGKTAYVVQRGDVLDRVAHKTKSNPELIYQANNLDRIMLRIGQRLEIPQVSFSIEVHLKPNKLVLLDHGQFFKSYPLLDSRPLVKKTQVISTSVQEKMAFRDGKRVTFGSKEYFGSLRSITLARQPGYTIYAKVEDGPPGTEKPAGSGLGLSASDAEELQTVVSVGTPVTITYK